MITETKTMRDVFIEQIYNRMLEDKNIFFLTADLGSPKLDKLREDFKDRFINVGIAEQNLVNVATGLALEGLTVYAYAIAPFLTMRAYEQIRNNLSLMSQVKEINVNLIGVGAGLSYDVSGPTHHCLEDISIMRTLPNFIVFSPSDWIMAQGFVDYSIKQKKPKYIRFDGKPLPAIYNKIDYPDVTAGLVELKRGEKICLVSTGYMTHRALNATARLNDLNINIGVIDIFLLKPFNEKLFLELTDKYDCLITLEEAFINKGGLDSIISCVLEKKDTNIKLKRMGIEDTYSFHIGSREYLHRMNKIDEESIIQTVMKLLRK